MAPFQRGAFTLIATVYSEDTNPVPNRKTLQEGRESILNASRPMQFLKWVFDTPRKCRQRVFETLRRRRQPDFILLAEKLTFWLMRKLGQKLLLLSQDTKEQEAPT
jgi:hypothetical protein